jgi:hypothetical protein
MKDCCSKFHRNENGHKGLLQMINCGKKKLGNVEKVDTFPEKYNLPD